MDELLFLFERETLIAMHTDASRVLAQPMNGKECHDVALKVIFAINAELKQRGPA